MAFAWVDQDRRYFIATRGTLEEVDAFLIQIWNQVAADINADYHMLDSDIPQIVSADMYYATYIAVNQHNRRRCDDLKLEKKLGIYNWNKCVKMSILFFSLP